jgi:excisionase family DNA binding protein
MVAEAPEPTSLGRRGALHMRETLHVRSVPMKFHTVEQVAEALNVSPRTVRRWIDNEMLVAHRIGGVVRIAEADLKAFLARHRDAS